MPAGFVILAGIITAVVVFSPAIGAVPIPGSIVAHILLHQATFGSFPADACGTPAREAVRCAIDVEIVWQDRVPAVLLALLAGAALGISGATLQGVFRNPLADPYLLGLSSGAALGAAIVIVFRLGVAEQNLTLPLFAFLGSLLTGAVVLLAARSPRSSVETLLLTGVALGAFLASILTVVLLYNPIGSLQVSYWLLGGLFGATWNRDGIVFGGLLVVGSFLVLYARELNLLQLGPDVAQTLGVDARKVRVRLLFLASLTTAIAVAFTGVIGFVGLVSPHIVRRVIGTDYRVVLPASALVGGAFLAIAHDLSQVVIPSTELPVGIPTSFAGAPFFLYLLYRRRRDSPGVRTS